MYFGNSVCGMRLSIPNISALWSLLTQCTAHTQKGTAKSDKALGAPPALHPSLHAFLVSIGLQQNGLSSAEEYKHCEEILMEQGLLGLEEREL